MKTIFLLLPFCLLVAGCSSEPSESELTEAVHVQYDAFNAETQRLMGRIDPSAQFTVHGVRKVGCKPDSSLPGYKCDVEIDVTTPGIGRDKSIKSIELETIASGWQVRNVF